MTLSASAQNVSTSGTRAAAPTTVRRAAYPASYPYRTAPAQIAQRQPAQIAQRQPAQAPAPGYSAPVPGAGIAPQAAGAAPQAAIRGLSTGSAYDKLPLNPGNAVARLEELRNLMPTMRPHDFQESIGEYCEWLSDMADAHWKLAQTFGKSDATKPQAESEKALCLKFGGLKRQAMLLKAEFLIGQRRYPEALGPLVDIVTAEPRTETGQNAYRLLQEIGFSQQLPPATAKEPTESKPEAAAAAKGVPVAKSAGTAH